MFINIVQHTPVWVWAVFGALLALGLRQSRASEVGLTRITVLPVVLLLLSFGGVLSAFGHTPVALGAWTTGVGVALTIARRAVAVRGAAWRADRALLQVPGSWVPLVLMLSLFSIKYAAGVLFAMAPVLALDPAVVTPFSLAYGSFSGLFFARALSLRALATQRAGAPAA